MPRLVLLCTLAAAAFNEIACAEVKLLREFPLASASAGKLVLLITRISVKMKSSPVSAHVNYPCDKCTLMCLRQAEMTRV